MTSVQWAAIFEGQRAAMHKRYALAEFWARFGRQCLERSRQYREAGDQAAELAEQAALQVAIADRLRDGRAA